MLTRNWKKKKTLCEIKKKKKKNRNYLIIYFLFSWGSRLPLQADLLKSFKLGQLHDTAWSCDINKAAPHEGSTRSTL